MFTAAGAITTNQTIQDNREAATIRLATLDVSKLVTTGPAAIRVTHRRIIRQSDNLYLRLERDL